MKNDELRQATVYLDEPTMEWIKAKCYTHRLSRSDVVRLALQEVRQQEADTGQDLFRSVWRGSSAG